MNGAPKQVLNVISGSLPRPTSVPAIFDVYPEMNWYRAWSTESFAMGGMTPDASQVRKMTFFGWPARFSDRALPMNSSGYDARVFSVRAGSSRSMRRVTGSKTTFSRIVPNRCVVA